MTMTITHAGEAHAARRALPLVDLPTLTGGATVLVLAPHPDDESIGCGGLVALTASSASPAANLVLPDGSGAHPGSRAWPPERRASIRADEARDAVAILGLAPDRLGFLGLTDAAVPIAGPVFEGAVRSVLARAASTDATILAAPWVEDPHSDHLAVHHVAREAARRAGLRLLSYPVWGWTLPPSATLREPGPIRGARLDIASVLDAKRRAVDAHRTQDELVIDDDPDAFVLPRVLLDPCDEPFEVFIETDVTGDR